MTRDIGQRGRYRHKITDVHKELKTFAQRYRGYKPFMDELARLENLIRQFKDDRHEPWLSLVTDFGISYVCVCGLTVDWYHTQQIQAWTWVNLPGHTRLDGKASLETWATWPWYPDVGEVYRTSAWGREQVALKVDADSNLP